MTNLSIALLVMTISSGFFLIYALYRLASPGFNENFALAILIVGASLGVLTVGWVVGIFILSIADGISPILKAMSVDPWTILVALIIVGSIAAYSFHGRDKKHPSGPMSQEEFEARRARELAHFQKEIGK